MKFLVDANLPPDLCVWLQGRGHEAEHLADLDLLTATDTQLWDRGRVQKLVVATKDVDFYDRALIFGAPPQVLHVALGNCSNNRYSKFSPLSGTILRQLFLQAQG